MAKNFASFDKRIVTLNYAATYKEDLPRVFEVLDLIQAEAEAEIQGEPNSDKLEQ